MLGGLVASAFLFSELQKTYLDLGHLTTLERRWIIDCARWIGCSAFFYSRDEDGFGASAFFATMQAVVLGGWGWSLLVGLVASAFFIFGTTEDISRSRTPNNSGTKMDYRLLGGLVLVLFRNYAGRCARWIGASAFLFSELHKTYLDLGHLTTLERRWIIDCSLNE